MPSVGQADIKFCCEAFDERGVSLPKTTTDYSIKGQI